MGPSNAKAVIIIVPGKITLTAFPLRCVRHHSIYGSQPLFIQFALLSHILDTKSEGVTACYSPFDMEVEPGAIVADFSVGKAVAVHLDFKVFWVPDGLFAMTHIAAVELAGYG